MAESADVVTVRLAAAADVPAISQLVRLLSARHIAPDLRPEGAERLARGQSEEAFRGYFDQGFRFHLALDGDALVGVVGTRAESHLFHLFVAETHQRRGIAGRLWEVARDAMIRAGGGGPYSVNASRSAVEAYRRLGFAVQAPEQERFGIVFTPMTWATP